jgi:hypothetical protein
MIRAKITPMMGRGAPAARARDTAPHRISCDLGSCRGLNSAIYDELAFSTALPLGIRWKDWNKVFQLLDLPSSVPSESVIGRDRYQERELKRQTGRKS